MELESLDQQRRPNESPATDRSSPMPKLRLVLLGCFSEREVRRKGVLCENTQYPNEEIGAGNVYGRNPFHRQQKGRHVGACGSGQIHIPGSRNAGITRVVANNDSFTAGGASWQTRSDASHGALGKGDRVLQTGPVVLGAFDLSHEGKQVLALDLFD